MPLKLVLKPYKPNVTNVASDASRLKREASVILGHVRDTCEPMAHAYLRLVEKYATEIVQSTQEVMQMSDEDIEKEAIRVNKEMVENMQKIRICYDLHEVIFDDIHVKHNAGNARKLSLTVAVTVVLLVFLYILWR